MGTLFCQKLCDQTAFDIGAGGQGGQGTKQIFELCIVVGPFILAQHLNSARLKTGDLFALLLIQAAQIQAGQGRDLIRAAAQRRKIQGQTAQPFTKGMDQRRRWFIFIDRAGEQQPDPACKTGLFDRGKQSGSRCWRDRFVILKIDGFTGTVQGRSIVIHQVTPAFVGHGRAIDDHHRAVGHGAVQIKVTRNLLFSGAGFSTD